MEEEEEEEEEGGEKREVSRGNVNVNGDEDNERSFFYEFPHLPLFPLFIHEIKDIIWIGPTLRFGQSRPKYELTK